eukprot:TRINITY_DN97_c1_g1_i1.p1 TRINITY_DN97_c1_g1~~TRINITY_DN97_c1_g1_i1.p1  ORF type:complete len:609 (-),score=180.75 TRINITY_DN97_c1_g1_i1:950-2707(-)
MAAPAASGSTMEDGAQEGDNGLCCSCGVVVEHPNNANMCVNCIRAQVDITEGIPKQLSIQWCKGCGRFLHTTTWVHCEPESRELLALLVRKVRGLNRVKLVDAGFVWTEPHSRRLKIKLTIQREVFTATILQQVFIVEFIMQNQFCELCHRSQTAHTWSASVQLRQHVGHKRTIYWLEQVILKANAHRNVLSIKEFADGLDFYFGTSSHAKKFVEFLQAACPIRFRTAKKLISKDDRSNTYNFKYSWSVEVVPVCREDLVCLPPRLCSSMGQCGPICLCSKVSGGMFHVVDTATLRHGEVHANVFWSTPFRALCTSRQLEEYTVLDVTPVAASAMVTAPKGMALCEVQVMRTSDFGRSNAEPAVVMCHLGNILKPGDTALGYSIQHINWNDDEADDTTKAQCPNDVVLVRKCYRRHRNRGRKARQQKQQKQQKQQQASEAAAAREGGRIWELQRLARDEIEYHHKQDEEQAEEDFEALMQSLEEDPELRSTVNMYRKAGVPVAAAAAAVRDARAASAAAAASAAPADAAMSDEDEDGEDDEEEEEEEEAPFDVKVDELLAPLEQLTVHGGGGADEEDEEDEEGDA